MNFKNIHMIAILTATLMVSTVAGYVLNQEAQANVYANGGNANGGNANGGNAQLAEQMPELVEMEMQLDLAE